DDANEETRHQRPAASLRSEPIADQRPGRRLEEQHASDVVHRVHRSRSLPRSMRERGCPLSLSICSSTLPFPSGARVSMNTEPGTASEALKRLVASAAAWCE